MNNGVTLVPEETRDPGRLLLPSLFLTSFVVGTPALLVGLLLIDIGQDFGFIGTSIGVMGQIRTVAMLVGAITAVLMGAWSVRFNHKSLLYLGLIFLGISAVGCALAVNFPMMLITFSLAGIGRAMVWPMTFSLVGEYFSLEQRPRAIGWLLSGAALTFFIGSPVIGFIVGLEFGGWRLAFFGYMLPVSLLSLMLVIKKVPAPVRSSHSPKGPEQYVEGFKGVLANRSAVACLVSGGLASAGWQALLFYSISFFRQRFLVSLEEATIIFPVLAAFYIFGNQFGGRTINQFGRKPVTVAMIVIAGIFTISFTNVPNLRLALALACLGGLFTGILLTASSSLTLEQVPEFRGTMMSLDSVAQNMGIALGTGIGGLVLIWQDYEGLGITLGIFSFTAALIYYLLVIDPTTNTEINRESHVESAQSTENGDV